jgi:hypothetical protein
MFYGTDVVDIWAADEGGEGAEAGGDIRVF